MRMNLKVLLPFQIFAEKTGVSRIVAETREGSFGLLPHRRDCVAALTPERVIREGNKVQEIFNLIDEDEDIAALMLAAGTGKEGPGPLVLNLGKAAGTFPIPIAIIPGNLADEELDAMS